MRYSNPWLRLTHDMIRLSAEASGVIALRTLKMAAGGTAAAAEAELMVAEKLKAAAEVQTQFWTSALSGSGHLAPNRAIAHYRKRVRANARRLSK
ncbi:hypothetical protein [Phenylobacterium sp.]|uniref:hypothetical protein n=1 Tax=Phenylobacterium sp. TaxID=1871053 RepID=UPI0025EEFF32|nr:hypothetical protein [Phenylobacterium sp.]